MKYCGRSSPGSVCSVRLGGVVDLSCTKKALLTAIGAFYTS